MSNLIDELKYKLYLDLDPYKNIEKIASDRNLEYDIKAFGSSFNFLKPYLDSLIPNLFIEVGTYKGTSVIDIGNYIRQNNWPTKILCIDTWLGSHEHILEGMLPLYIDNGHFEHFYYQFLYNIKKAGLENIVIPFRNTSRNAAEVLKRMDIKAELIYVDGSHLSTEVFHDLEDYREILTNNGLIIGDDYPIDIVRNGYENFCTKYDLEQEIISNWKFIVRK